MTQKSLTRCAAALIMVALLFVVGVMPSAAQGVAPLMPLRLTIDASRFRGADDSTASLEIYYAFSEGALTYTADSTGLRGTGDITLMITEHDSLLHADRWLVPHIVTDTSQLHKNLTLTGVYPIGLRRGDYVLKVLLRDRNDAQRKDSVVLRVPIRPVATSGVAMGDLEFASVIRQGKKGGPFYKNTLDVIPNASGLYGEEQSCYYYTEAYNLLNGSDQSDYHIKTVIYDAVGKEVMSRDRARKRQAESTVIVDNFPVNTMRSGSYTLAVSILDTAENPLSTSAKRFYVYNPTLGVDSSLISSASTLPLAVYASMGEAELDQEFKMARYETTGEERSQYESLKGADAKRKFLSNLWRHRPAGAREEYLARAAYANANFRVMGREGYKTDRGRVYITYGAPDDYERHPNEPESRPYEIWSYNTIQGGVIFVFCQRSTGGDYELIHSTHRNELRNDNWEQLVTVQQ